MRPNMGTDEVKASLLLVEDEAPLLTLLTRYLRKLGYQVESASTGAEALEQAQKSHPHAIVLDLGLPDMAGEEVMRRLLELMPGCRILVSSGTPFSNEILPAAQRRQVDFLQKPYLPKSLLDSLEALLGRQAVAGSGH